MSDDDMDRLRRIVGDPSDEEVAEMMNANADLVSTPDELPPFPVDDTTLDLLDQALDARVDVNPELLMPKLLDFLSGYDPSKVEEGPDGIDYYPGEVYSRDSVIRALIDEVRRLRG